MSIAEIICHHCGRNYARQYWLVGGSDPRVCNSCRRDTNPDAADAPRGSQPPREDLPPLAEAVAPYMIVSKARKKCRVCGGEWDGLIFGPTVDATKGSDAPLPFGTCDACADADERTTAAMSARTVSATAPLPEMRRPRRMTGLDYD